MLISQPFLYLPPTLTNTFHFPSTHHPTFMSFCFVFIFALWPMAFLQNHLCFTNVQHSSGAVATYQRLLCWRQKLSFLPLFLLFSFVSWYLMFRILWIFSTLIMSSKYSWQRLFSHSMAVSLLDWQFPFAVQSSLVSWDPVSQLLVLCAPWVLFRMSLPTSLWKHIPCFLL